MLDVYFEIRGECGADSHSDPEQTGVYNARAGKWMVGLELIRHDGTGTRLADMETALMFFDDAAADRDMRDVRIETVEVDLGEEESN